MSDGIDTIIDHELICRIEQFYYREARLLDERHFLQWQALLCEDIRYTIPTRYTTTADAGKRGTEALHDIDQELSRCGADELPLREEDIFALAVRIDRSLKPNSWTDNPPPRTRRLVTNVEVARGDSDGEYRAFSNFLLRYSRHASDDFLYTGRRRDLLRANGDSFRLAEREVILEQSVIDAPTLGLMF